MFFDPLKCVLDIGNATIHLENLFNGNERLEQSVNQIVNDHIQVFIAEIKPNILNTICEFFTDVANNVTKNFDIGELFPVL